MLGCYQATCTARTAAVTTACHAVAPGPHPCTQYYPNVSSGGSKGNNNELMACSALYRGPPTAPNAVQVLLEIQDTLRQPPKARTSMHKAITIGVSGAFVFYFSSAVACYSALGDSVPGEVLSGFESE